MMDAAEKVIFVPVGIAYAFVLARAACIMVGW